MAECIGAAAKACSDQNFMPVGTGPYMVTDLRPEDTVTYEYNPNYRGLADGMPFFETVSIKGGGDAEASARSVLEIGEADYAWNLQVAPEILEPMEAAGNGALVSSFTSSVTAEPSRRSATETRPAQKTLALSSRLRRSCSICASIPGIEISASMEASKVIPSVAGSSR